MRSGSIGLTLTGWTGVAAVSVLGALTGGCTVSNEGNVTTPPPPSVFPASGSGGSGGSGSVIPSDDMSDLSKRLPSTGCALEGPPDGQVPTIPGNRTGYTEYFVNQTGVTLGTDEPTNAGERQFFVRIPPDYDPKNPYRIVYIGQGCGAYRAAKNNTYPLFIEAQGGTEQAIYVAVSVPDNDANPSCYDNNSGPQSQEWEAFELMHTFIEGNFCVDNNRVFVTGYSTGGWLSNMWGCYFGGIPDPPRKFSPKWAMRGHAAVTGSLPPNQPACSGPSAGFWLHDAGDTGNRIATNIAAINLQLKTNGCEGNYEDGPKKPWAAATGINGLSGDICKEYTGCDPEVAAKYPIVFCTTNGLGHGDQSTSAIPAITKFFDLMNPASP